MKKIYASVLAAVLFASGLSAQEQKLPAVIAAPVIHMDFTPEAYEIGETKAEESVALVARIKGYLTKVNFIEGSKVKAGTVLFEIDPLEYEAKVKQSKAELAKAKAQRDHDDSEEKRQKELFDKNAISAKEYARYQTNKLESEAALLAAEAALKLAELDLKYTKIIAPFDGYMGFKSCSAGNLVGSQTETLATIEKAGKVKVDFFLSDNDAGKLTRYVQKRKLNPRDVPVELFYQDGTKVPLTGFVTAWDNKINPSTGTLKMQALFDDPNHIMIPGIYVRVKLSIGEKERKLAVRKSAVSDSVTGHSVMVLKNAKNGTADVEQRYVKPVSADDRYYYFESGLNENELVVVSGIQRVRNGGKCTYTEEGVNPAARAGAANAQ